MPSRRSRRRLWAMKGPPATETRALGNVSVCGRSRVASPPARIATGGIALESSLLRKNLCAFKIEVEPNLGQTSLAHGVPQPHLVLNVEHEKAAPTRADQFPANRSVLQCKIVPSVNLRV